MDQHITLFKADDRALGQCRVVIQKLADAFDGHLKVVMLQEDLGCGCANFRGPLFDDVLCPVAVCALIKDREHHHILSRTITGDLPGFGVDEFKDEALVGQDLGVEQLWVFLLENVARQLQEDGVLFLCFESLHHGARREDRLPVVFKELNHGAIELFWEHHPDAGQSLHGDGRGVVVFSQAVIVHFDQREAHQLEVWRVDDPLGKELVLKLGLKELGACVGDDDARAVCASLEEWILINFGEDFFLLVFEAIQQNIKSKRGHLSGHSGALLVGDGDCEGLMCLFNHVGDDICSTRFYCVAGGLDRRKGGLFDAYFIK